MDYYWAVQCHIRLGDMILHRLCSDLNPEKDLSVILFFLITCVETHVAMTMRNKYVLNIIQIKEGRGSPIVL